MGRKVHCTNASCKHYRSGNSCDTTVKIGDNGKCFSFEKGFPYYFHIVWNALGNSNYIDMIDIVSNPDLRIGLHYVMDCFGLGYCEMEWGTSRMIMLKEKADGDALGYKQIIERDVDNEKFRKHLNNFNAGILPKANPDGPKADPGETKNVAQKKGPKEFGWLSPTGEFTESSFGKHEESAMQICKEKGFVDEYRKWTQKPGNKRINYLMRDFLQHVKGYCLIHNPSGFGGYIVTNMKSLTKQQKEFLYTYFKDMGDMFKAEQFYEK